MIPHLRDKPLCFSQLRQRTTLLHVKTERLLTKHMQILIKCISNHFTMETRRRRDEHAVKDLSIYDLSIIGIRFNASVFFH
jgi:hypothetical protein